MELRRRQILLFGMSVAVLTSLGALVACSGGSAGSNELFPQDQGHLVAPTSGLDVTASITSVTLGDACAQAGAAPSSSLCAQEDAGAAADGGSSRGGDTSNCGGTPTCQQSNMQLDFITGAGSKDAKVEIVSVSLRDGTSGSEVDTLTPSLPQTWTDSKYMTWDETLKPSEDRKASYNLTAPNWANLSKTGSSTTYQTKYYLVVTLRIDGAEMVLKSALLNREPVVAT